MNTGMIMLFIWFGAFFMSIITEFSFFQTFVMLALTALINHCVPRKKKVKQ